MMIESYTCMVRLHHIHAIPAHTAPNNPTIKLFSHLANGSAALLLVAAGAPVDVELVVP
jgi:hypothetical protein